MQITYRRPDPEAWRGRRWRRRAAAAVGLLAVVLALASGCARFNTYYNAQQAFNEAERAREEAIKRGDDVTRAATSQRANYLRAISKAQKVLDEYPGHSLSDDALFLQAKAHQRLTSYRMSIRQLELLFANFPQTPYLEEALFLQAVNYLLINEAGRSQDMLDLLERQFPQSRFQAEALRTSGDNAYSLRDWDAAIGAYERYLQMYPDAENWDDSSLRQAESLWELERYDEAVPVLERIIAQSNVAERGFRARMLLGRCYIRLQELDRADAIISALKLEAELYNQQGMVGMIEAENLLARGQRSLAISLLEELPDAWLTREIKPLWADMLAYAYLEAEPLDIETLEKAREYFQQTTAGGVVLPDPERSRGLLTTVRDYLAAANQLPDAAPDRAARLRLLQANALLFGFDRPRAAYDLFVHVAADSAADTTEVTRALYGAMLVQADRFQQPDSAAVFAAELQARFPDSPQAYQARSGAQADLLAFLLQQEYAALQAAAAAREGVGEGPATGVPPALRTGSGLRRQQVYLQRRANLVFAPPPAAVQALAARREREQAAAPPLPSRAPADTTAVVRELGRESAPTVGPALTDTLAAPRLETAIPIPAPESAAPDTAVQVPPAEQPPATPEPKRPRRWDF